MRIACSTPYDWQRLLTFFAGRATPGVEAVDNELQVVPKVALSDEAIERRIRAIVKTDERFYNTAVKARVEQGNVFLSGSFLRYRDPSILKHKVAEIEGVVDIEIRATFFAWPSVKTSLERLSFQGD